MHALARATLMAVMLGLSACAVRPRPTLTGTADPSEIPAPFAPARLDLHALTRMDRDAEGKLWIIAFIDLKDAWGDATKGVGQLQVQLFRQVGGSASTVGEHELTWDVDLADLERNASLYDSATRMYRLPLEDAPEWLVTPPADDRPTVRGRLRATLDTFGPRGESLRLEDELTIGG